MAEVYDGRPRASRSRPHAPDSTGQGVHTRPLSGVAKREKTAEQVREAARLAAADKREAQRELDRNGGSLTDATLALLDRKWPAARVAAAVGRSESWVRQQVTGPPRGAPRATVHCPCGWVGKRPNRVDPTAVPCPKCGGKRLSVAVRRLPTGTPRRRLNVYLDESTYQALAASGGPSTEAALILTRHMRARSIGKAS